MLSDIDQDCAQLICDECEAFERGELWVRASADCGYCKGFPYRLSTSDVQEQFGVCGCLVALEMEMEEAYLPLQKPFMSSMPKAVDAKLVRAMLVAMPKRHASDMSLYYLHTARRSEHEVAQAHTVKTTQMKTRSREKKNKLSSR